MPSPELKQREESLQAFLKRLDVDLDLFTHRLESLRKKHDELTGVVLDAGLEPVPISFAGGKNADVLKELENHILELNKMKNLIQMKLKRIIQEEDLLEHLQSEFGKNVSFKRNVKGGIELQIKDLDAETAYDELEQGKRKLEQLRSQIHQFGDDE
ncbi:MAG: hypothetical protein AABX02_05235 [archaeon]